MGVSILLVICNDDCFLLCNPVIQPPWRPRGLSGECVLCIPMRVVKGNSKGRFPGITVKRLAPCRCLDGHVKESY